MLALMSFWGLEKANAQTEVFRQLVEGKRYIFLAQSVSPMTGNIIQLTSLYTFSVMPDSMISDLPYFGRVYQPSMTASDGGIKFTSANFIYSAKERKKGGWEIKIKPKDVRNSPIIFLSISADGYAMVRISSADREAIAYNGRIEGVRKK